MKPSVHDSFKWDFFSLDMEILISNMLYFVENCHFEIIYDAITSKKDYKRRKEKLKLKFALSLSKRFNRSDLF